MFFQYNDVAWTSGRLKSPTTWLFVQQIIQISPFSNHIENDYDEWIEFIYFGNYNKVLPVLVHVRYRLISFIANFTE